MMQQVVGAVKRYFVDMRFILGLMCVWLVIVIAILTELGMFAPSSSFVAFGPRDDLRFMHMAIDSYFKYNLLVVLIVVNTLISDFIADSLGPHVLNVVQDPKILVMPHRKIMYIILTSTWSVYCAITLLFNIFIAFAQLDLLVVRLLSDLLANFVTMNMYMHGKRYDPLTYQQVVSHHGPLSTACDNNVTTPMPPSTDDDRSRLLPNHGL